jgi:hypothetical protein
LEDVTLYGLKGAKEESVTNLMDGNEERLLPKIETFLTELIAGTVWDQISGLIAVCTNSLGRFDLLIVHR